MVAICDNGSNIISKFWCINTEGVPKQVMITSNKLSYGNNVEQNIIGNLVSVWKKTA